MTTVTIGGLSSTSSVYDVDLAVIDQEGTTKNITRAMLVGSANNIIPATCAAFGYNNTVSGTYNLSVGACSGGGQNTTYFESNHCVTVGFGNTMSGYYSTAIGQLNSVATEGYVVKSVAIGFQNTVNNPASTACGYRNRTSSDNCTVVGYYNQAYDGNNATAIGYQNTVTGFGSTATGWQNTVSTYLSTATGFSNTVSGGYAQAFGIDNTASAYGATAAGYRNFATANGTTAAGYKNQATRFRGTSIGYENQVSGNASSAFGYNNTVSGYYSSAVGYQNSASSVNSNAFGHQNYDNSENSPYSNLFGTLNYSSNSFATTAFGLLNNQVGGSLVRSSGVISGSSSNADTIGVASVAFGILNTAAGDYSSAVGIGNKTGNLNGNSSAGDNTTSTTSFLSDGAPWSGVGPGSGPFTSTVPGAQQTDDITLYDFAFNIPGDAIVTGIEIGIEWDGDGGIFTDSYAYLTYLGEPIGGNFATNENTGGVVSYGSPTTIPGGATFSGGDVNNSSFGVAFAVNGSGAGTATVYGAEIEVFYIVNNNSSAVGYNNIVNSANSHAFGGFNYLNANSTSSVSLGLLNNSQGTELDWRTGSFEGTPTAADDIGVRSIAVGILNTTSGYYGSTAVGYGNSVSGYSAVSVGMFNTSSGSYSVTFGSYNQAAGESSTAGGYENFASGSDSQAIGQNNQSGGEQSSAFGYDNSSSGQLSSAFGYNNSTTQQYASAFGSQNQANNQQSSAFGRSNTAGAYRSNAFGWNNNTSGSYCSAFGSGNNAGDGSYSVAFGQSNTANNNSSCAVGIGNTSSGGYASAIGVSNQATQTSAVAVGYANQATAGNASAVGWTNTVSGTGSSAFGFNNTVSAYGSVAVGVTNSVTVGNATAAGYHNTVSSDKGNAFGFINTVSGSHATAIGSNSVARIDYTVNTNPIITRKDNGEDSGTEFQSFGGVENVLMSHVVDLTGAGDHQVVLPSGCSFYPDEVGVIITSAAGVTVQPTVRFGDEVLGEYTTAPTLRQANSQPFDNGSLTPSLNWGEPTLSGSMLILIVTFYEGDLAAVPSGWTYAASGNQPNVQTYIYYALPTDPTHSGTETVTFNSIAFNGSGVLFIAEYQNWGTGAFLDQVTGASGFGDTADTGPTSTTTQNHELWIASFGSSGGTGFTTPSGDWSDLAVNTFGGGDNYYGIYVLNATSEGAAEAVSGFDMSGSAQWTSALATFGQGQQQDYANLLSETTTTSLTAAKQRQRFTSLNNYNGHTTLTAGVTVGATADVAQGRFYWKGILVEDN